MRVDSEMSMEDLGFGKNLDYEKLLSHNGVNIKINTKKTLKKFSTFDKTSTIKT